MPSGPQPPHFGMENFFEDFAAGKGGGQKPGLAEYVDRSVDVRVLYRMPVFPDDGIGQGWVAERLKAPVLKTGRPARASWVRIPPHPPPIVIS